jgi:hypothetical protein
MPPSGRSLCLVAALSALQISCACDRTDETRKRPHLIFTGSNTEMEITWQTSATQLCTLEWGPDATYGAAVAPAENGDATDQHIHSRRLTGLTPGRTYFYRVSTSDGRYEGSFDAPPEAGSTALKLFAYGDVRGDAAAHDAVVGRIMDTFAADPAFRTLLLSMGDLVLDGDSEEDWDDEFFSPALANVQRALASMPYVSAIGNHEGKGSLFDKYFPYPLSNTDHYWSFDYGPLHVALLNMKASYAIGSAQYAWLEGDLAASQKPWKIVVTHYPAWSADVAGDLESHENDPTFQTAIEPLCEANGVGVVLQGHNHYYARADVSLDGVHHVQHVTVAGGGAPLEEPKNSPPMDDLVVVDKTYNYGKIEISGDTLTFTAMGVDIPNGTETVIDVFSIVR